MKLSLIAAIGQQNELGKDNKMAWYYPEDLKFFAKTTIDIGTILMGRKTLESIKNKPLLNRLNIVLSNNKASCINNLNFANLIAIQDFNLIFDLAKLLKKNSICIIGGAQIYTQALQIPELQTCYITRIPETVQGADAFFPIELLEQNFILSQSREQVASNGKTLVFETWERKTF